jgi:ubiquinone/menaquinone biosynthesis C-methylase UbiE
MSALSEHLNQLKVSEAFDKQSEIFDSIYGKNVIIEYKRQRVREHILSYAKSEGFMLELNCGTGEDALFFAKKGFKVHATDISSGMLNIFQKKIETTSPVNISLEECSFTELESLKERGPFDYVYSNFGGLNCTRELGKVLSSLHSLVKPGGTVTLVIISKFCFWETLLLFKGKFKMAFRRFFSGKGRKAHLEGVFFKCWYYSPAFVRKQLEENFELLSIEALCTIVPPSYFDNFAHKRPALFSYLKAKENKLKAKWPWKLMGDYFIISLKRKTGLVQDAGL